MYVGIKAAGYKEEPIGQFQTIAEGIRYVKSKYNPDFEPKIIWEIDDSKAKISERNRLQPTK